MDLFKFFKLENDSETSPVKLFKPSDKSSNLVRFIMEAAKRLNPPITIASQRGEEMDDDSCSDTENLRANWTPPQDQYFVELLVDQMQSGNKIGHAFKQQAWADMITQFNSNFGFRYDIDVLKNRFKRMRKQYNEMKILLDQSGFEWDEATQIVKADNNTWDEYLKAHPDFQTYRAKVVPYYRELCMICGHTVADGRYSLSCFDIDFENEEKRVDDKTPSSGNRSKIEWTLTMDQYFLELMIDQVHKGNKVGCTFKKEAWVRMIILFNAKFGFQHSRAVLKNRYKILRSQYASIRTLLTQKGFHWDETQKMVIADDCIWSKCIKEHPDFRRYKNKTMPCYDDMCIIFRDESASKKKRTVQCNVSENGTPGKDISGRSTPTINNKVAKKVHNEVAAPGLSSKSQEQQNKQQSQRPSTSNQPKRGRSEYGMSSALQKLAFMITSIKKKKENADVSTERVIEELQAIPGVDDDLLLDACDFLEDDRRARMFLALDVSLRKKWLMRKLRP
ncbi:hypothetical protein PTKIN_Ptkin06aG0073300 [Pterospermum kingtungense]